MTSDTPRGRFDIGRVISRTFGVLRRNLAIFTGLALVLSGLPNLLFSLSTQRMLPSASDSSSFAPASFSLMGLGGIISLLASVLLQGAVVYATASDINGKPATLGDCLGAALPHALPLIGIGVCVAISAFVGSLLFLVPGIIIALALCVSAPVRVVEGRGVFASMSRSGDLTRGHRWMLLLLFFLFFVGFSVVQAVAGQLAGLLSFAASGSAFLVRTVILNTLMQTLAAPIGAVGIASVYIELREIKEGGGLEALAAVFD